MKEITVSETLSLSKNLLFEFDKVCRKHDIKYSLGYGSLLGAVRHKGMIPWDDDVDIVMPRADYDRLCDIYSNSNQTDRYQLVNHRNHPEIATKISYFNDFSTVTDFAGKQQEYKGVHIDIYPLDVVPNDRKLRKKLIFKRNFYQRIIRIKDIHPELFSGVKKIIRLLAKAVVAAFDSDAVYDNLNEICRQYKDIPPEEGSNVSCLIESGKVCMFERAVTDKYCLYSFDEFELYGFEDYDKPLTSWYGEYMTPPPEDQRRIVTSKWVHHYYKQPQ